jgi:hypothetical protein
VGNRQKNRFITKIKSASFKLTEENPAYLAARHAEFAGQVLGIRLLIKHVDESGKKLEREEEKNG